MSGRISQAVSSALIAGIAAFGTLAIPSGSRAVDAPARTGKSPSDPAAVRQVFVPVNRPMEWPKGDWEIIRIEEYRQLVGRLKPKPLQPAAAQIEHARYQAFFTGESLTAGRLTARIVHSSGARHLLPLDPSNLTVSELAWETTNGPRDAVWGTTKQDRTLLVIPASPAATSPAAKNNVLNLHGAWSLAGHRFSDRVEFDLKIPPAAVNELDLHLPAGWTLESSQGQVEGPLPAQENAVIEESPTANPAALKRWRVHLGSENACRLSARLPETQTTANMVPLVLVESDTNYLVRERELQVEARFDLNIAIAPTKEIVFHVPRAIRIYAVTYGGDANLTWNIESAGNHQQLTIQLPDPQIGKSRPIRIQGLSQVLSGRAWLLPQIKCLDVALIRGEVHLTVEAPLELGTYQAIGYRQTAISVLPDQRETLTFSQTAVNSRFTAFVGTPALSMTAQIVSHLVAGTEEWQMRSEMTWIAQAGSRFVTVCEVLPGWEILDVRRGNESAASQISDWRLARKADATQLNVEFTSAITPMQNQRVQILARRLPMAPDETMPLSCVKPVSCRSVEQFLAVDSPQGDRFSLESPVGSSPAKPPKYAANSPLFQRLNTTASARPPQFFFSTIAAPDPLLLLKRVEPPFHASARVMLEMTNQHIDETWVLSIRPLNMPLDKVSILGGPAAGEWEWTIGAEEDGSREPVALVSFTELPAEDALAPTRWVLGFSHPQSQPFQLIGKRHIPVSRTKTLALPFLPAAHDFQGEVELKSSFGEALEVLTNQLQEQPADTPPGKRLPQRWQYQTPDASVRLELDVEEAADDPILARFKLYSLLSDANQSCMHRARFELETYPKNRLFPFRLPNGARLIAVRVNGDAVSPTVSNGEHILSYLPSDQKNVIELDYQTPWVFQGIESACTVEIPKTELTIVESVWQLGISPNLRLTQPPTGMTFITPAPAPHWTSRFFGPLGRGQDNGVFAPWNWPDWESLFRAKSNPTTTSPPVSRTEFFPQGWQVHEVRGSFADGKSTVEAWNRARGLTWAWIALFASLLIGFSIRIFDFQRRRQLGLFWFLVNLICAGLLPMPWSMISGGCLSGTLIAFLLPRRFLVWTNSPPKVAIPLGSTASFQRHPALGLLWLCGWGCWAAHFSDGKPAGVVFGQERPAVRPDGLEPPRQDKPAFNVMIPVEDPRHPQADSQVVYVEREFLAKLRSIPPIKSPDESYLISSADYDVSVDDAGAVEISATFEIALLSQDHPVQVRLPIENAYLGGANHCLVDGSPHTVLEEPMQSGYVVELIPKRSKNPTSGPAIAEKLREPEALANGFAKFQIQLRLHGSAAIGPESARYLLKIPPITKSRIAVKLPASYPLVSLSGSQGTVLAVGRGNRIAAQLGPTRELEIFWSPESQVSSNSGSREAEVFALATVHPLWVEWQIHVKYRPKPGLSQVQWTLPANTFVQKVSGDPLARHDVHREGRATRLLMEFDEPQRTAFSLQATCLTPWNTSALSAQSKVRLPALDLFRGDKQSSPAKVAYFLGVLSTPELTLGSLEAATTSDAKQVAIPPDKFLQAYRSSIAGPLESRLPQFAWNLKEPGEIWLTSQSREPSRRVRMNQQGQVHPAEIKWLVTAEIETNAAAAYRHVFQVPSELVIDSISVKEDETERLVRWTKTGTRLELVLTDGTTGIQDVTLAGHVPFLLKAGAQTKLPLVVVEDAILLDSRLRIDQEQNANPLVEVARIEEWPTLENGSDLEVQKGFRRVAAVLVPASAQAPLLIVSPEASQWRYDRASLVGSPHALRNKITTLIRPYDDPESPPRLGIHLPTSLTQEFRIELLDQPGVVVPYETITHPDQSLDLWFDATALGMQPVLKIESFTNQTRINRWKPDFVTVFDAALADDFVLVSSAFDLLADEAGIPATRRDARDLPSWMAEANPFDDEPSGTAIYKNLQQEWSLLPTPLERTDEALSLVTTHVWLTNPARMTGHTVLQFHIQDLEQLRWKWTPDTTFEGALLNGIPVSAAMDENKSMLRVPLPSQLDSNSSSLNTLELYWTRESSNQVPRFGQFQLSLPMPLDIPIREADLTIVPPSSIRLLPKDGIFSARDNDKSLSGLPAQGTFSGQFPTDAEEWTADFWTIDSRSEEWLTLVLLVLGIGGILYWGLRWNSGEWFFEHPTAAFCLLGFLWWMFLAGSPIGFAVFLSAPLLALFIKRKPRETAEVLSEV